MRGEVFAKRFPVRLRMKRIETRAERRRGGTGARVGLSEFGRKEHEERRSSKGKRANREEVFAAGDEWLVSKVLWGDCGAGGARGVEWGKTHSVEHVTIDWG